MEVHIASLKLPSFELYEQGSQIRNSSKSVKDQIAEKYGRRRYKPEFIKFLIYSQSSCDETTSQLEMITVYIPTYWIFKNYTLNMIILGKKLIASSNLLKLTGKHEQPATSPAK